MIVRINEGTKYERVIGRLDPKHKVFEKKVKASIHLFKKLDAWGVDAEYFTNVLVPGNYLIRVIDTENGKTYEVTASIFKKHGEFFHFKEEDNEDHRAQIFLSRRNWNIPKKVPELTVDEMLKYAVM